MFCAYSPSAPLSDWASSNARWMQSRKKAFCLMPFRLRYYFRTERSEVIPSMFCGCRRLLQRAKRLESNGYYFRIFNTEMIFSPSAKTPVRPPAAGVRACLISQRVRIGEIDFLSCKAKSRSNPYRAMTPSVGPPGAGLALKAPPCGASRRGHARLFCTGARCACCRILTDCKDF